MSERKNPFGHSSIAQPSATDERAARMHKMVQDEQFNPYNQKAEEVNAQQDYASNMSASDLEQLVFLGCIEDTKVINNFKFDMRTLTGKEQNDVWLSVSFLNADTKFLVVKIAFLSRAIMAVNGRDLEVLYKGKDYREITKEQRCVRVIESWQDTLINELYEFYSQLVDRSKKAIRPDDIKK